MAQDTKATPVTFHENPKAAMREFIGGYPWNRMAALPELDAPIEEIEASGVFAGLEGREEYLAWVASYKELIKQAAEHIRQQKRLRSSEEDHVRYSAQEEVAYLGQCVTAAIHLRRLGKRWSAARAAALRAAA